jgi:hypothetical protein
MKKSFLTYLFIFLFLYASPFFAYSQSTNPDLPGEESDAGDGLLPDRGEINPTAPSDLDGVDLGVDPPPTPPEKETFPTGSGYTENNGTATQPPTPPGSRNESFPTGSGSTYGTGALLKVPTPPTQPTPTSVSILDSLVSSKLFGNEPLDKLLNQLFYIGLIAAVILAIVMIIRGGLEYMTIDAITSKENGKNRVKAALGGLLLAFSAILILNTINPGLTKLNLTFPQLQGISQTVLETEIYSAVNSYIGLTPEQYQEFLATGKIPTNISPTAQRVLAEALNSVNTLKTGKDEAGNEIFKGTEYGNLACAAAANAIYKKATGQEIGGGTSIQTMYEILKKDPRFEVVPGGIATAQPGDIIISPGEKRHVGFFGINGTIISNSSTKAVVKDHFTSQKWTNYYGASNTFVYRPR